MAGRQLSHRNQGRTTLESSRARLTEGLIPAAAALVAFACYYATLLPGLELGDSASFQTGVGSLDLTPRQAYPLYYGLGSLFALVYPGEPARALNFASAVYGAVAVGIATLLTIRATESRAGGLVTGLLLAFSYTFWSQAILAEVYTLHLLIVGAAIVALLAWSTQQTTTRLAAFYAVYALGFGNHLSMVLLLPAFAAFLLMERHAGPADPLRPRMIALAVGLAFVGALQYAWNFRGLWTSVEPPVSMYDAIGKFWFDVTKSDWRETIVMNVSEAGLEARPAMYWFDLRQQFGVPGVALAVAGAIRLLARRPRVGGLLVLTYLANLAFAWTYNVGDAYIFFLPSHYVLAILAGAGVAGVLALAARSFGTAAASVLGLLCVVYPIWRGYDTFPAVDRSHDLRAIALLDHFTAPSPGGAVYGVDTNWQVQNAFEYFMRERRPGTPWFTTEELLWMDEGRSTDVDAFVEGNREIDRDVVLSPLTYRRFAARSGASPERTREAIEGFTSKVSSLSAGAYYALGILTPDREFPLDTEALRTAWGHLSSSASPLPELKAFTVVVGRVGETPLFVRSEDRPYRARFRVGSTDFDVRMEAWLPTDTIRRAGFGRVLVNRETLVMLERGVSFAALGSGEAVYLSGLFAPIPRYRWGMEARP
jgi:hypothetical protein